MASRLRGRTSTINTTVDIAPHPWAGKTLTEMLQRSVELWPERVAIVDGELELTYAEFAERTRAAAAALAERGIREGDHVAVLLPQTWYHVVLLGALHYLGVVVVPLNLTWQPDEVRFALDAAECDVFVVGGLHRGTDLLVSLGELGLSDEGRGGLSRLRLVLSDPEQLASGHSAVSVEQCSNPEAYIMFTSGSTAHPKGAIVTHAAVLGCAHFVAERLSIAAGDRFLNVMPMYHCGGLVCVFAVAHQRGATVYLFDGYQHDEMVRTAREEQTGVLIGFDVVTMRLVDALVELDGRTPFRKMITGPGISVYDRLTELGIDVAIVYALTESSNVVSITAAADPHEGRRETNGTPLPGVSVRISDEAGASLPPNESGEICFKGWNLMRGYYRAGSPPRLELDEDGYFHTGDYGHLDDAGRVCYRGRFAMMVKTGGENVSQVEVENFLMSNVPRIRQAAVIGIPDVTWGEMVVAFVEREGGEPLPVEELRELSRGKLAGYKVPKRVITVAAGEWPVSPTGKIQKNVLVDRAANPTENQEE